jgi:hypothetical protein
MDKEFDTALELSENTANFLARYNSEFCHHLQFHVEEKVE